MATLDRRGVTVDATDAPAQGDPNPGLAWKAPVHAATTGSDITLSGLQTIDGVSLAEGDRVLVKDQTDPRENGIYSASSGLWLRTVDFNSNDQVASGLRVAVNAGTIHKSDTYALTTADPIDLGVTDLTWERPVPPAVFDVNAGTYNVTDETVLLINKAVPAASNVQLPPSADRGGTPLVIKDFAGNAATYTKTILPSGVETIDGLSSLPINANYGGYRLVPLDAGGWYVSP